MAWLVWFLAATNALAPVLQRHRPAPQPRVAVAARRAAAAVLQVPSGLPDERPGELPGDVYGVSPPPPPMSGLPERIILVRHGLSEGNVDKEAYGRVPDSLISLTERGFAQGQVAGLQIRELVGNETVRFFYSPYMRARQTLLAILQAFDSQTVQISSEPRLREQDFGNFQDPTQMDEVFKERQKFGRFYFRFPNGEAGTDVFDRVASFITYLFRSMGERG